MRWITIVLIFIRPFFSSSFSLPCHRWHLQICLSEHCLKAGHSGKEVGSGEQKRGKCVLQGVSNLLISRVNHQSFQRLNHLFPIIFFFVIFSSKSTSTFEREQQISVLFTPEQGERSRSWINVCPFLLITSTPLLYSFPSVSLSIPFILKFLFILIIPLIPLPLLIHVLFCFSFPILPNLTSLDSLSLLFCYSTPFSIFLFLLHSTQWT